MPDDLRHQWGKAPGLFAAFGWSALDHDALEADDLVHSLGLAEAEAGGEALILTGDRDMYQCVSDRVALRFMRTGSKGPEEIGPAEVREHAGVDPEQIPDLIALRGDPSDGIPGARGIGAKTAADLLGRHGTLEAVLAAADGEKPRIAAVLKESADLLRSFREVATAQRIPVELPTDSETDLVAGSQAAQELGMRRLAERLAAQSG
jgi:DNA polymerase-1